jgi:hypothetical protein
MASAPESRVTQFVPETIVLIILGLTSCIGCASARPQTVDVQKMVDAGGTVIIPEGTYELARTIVVRKSNTIIKGAGPKTVFVFKPTTPEEHCGNDRAFTTPCDVVDTGRRRISSPIAIGDNRFTTADRVDNLHSGDWLIVMDMDQKAGDVVKIDWAQVDTASENTVVVRSPFRIAFPNERPWDPHHSGLGFYVLPQLVEGVQFRDFKVVVPDIGRNTPGISLFAAKDSVIDNVEVQCPSGQPLYSYLSKGLTLTNARGYGGKVLSELAATVDLKVKGNTFSANSAAVGLDFGTGFFELQENVIPSSLNSGIYLLYGVHDGEVSGNSIEEVKSDGQATGILARGTQNVSIVNNSLNGPHAPTSVGISIGPAYDLEHPIPSSGNTVTPNTFGPGWSTDYDPTNVP